MRGREGGREGGREREEGEATPSGVSLLCKRRQERSYPFSTSVSCVFLSFLDAGVSAWIRLPVSLRVLVSVDFCVCNFLVFSNSSFNTRAIRSALQD